jgi:uncharacterized protein
MPEIETPCTKVCTLDPASGLCRGCGRTGGEIERWTRLSGAERRRIMAALPQRLAALACAAGDVAAARATGRR